MEKLTKEIFESALKSHAEAYKKVKAPSVSAIIGQLHAEFDREGQAARCAKKGMNDPESKYFGMTAEMIMKQWSTKAASSISLGKLSDSYIGCILDNLEKDEATRKDIIEKFFEAKNINESGNVPYDLLEKCPNDVIQGFNEFKNAIDGIGKYNFIGREKKLFYVTENNSIINGRFDCAFSYNDDHILLVDWKTSGTIDMSNKWSKMLGPLYEYDDANFFHYSMQLSIYKYALTEILNIPSANIDIVIVQLGELNEGNNKRFRIYPAHNFSKEQVQESIDFGYKKIKEQEALEMTNAMPAAPDALNDLMSLNG